MRCAFVDTNLLIHFKQLDQINWFEHFEEEQLKFLVPICVIQELDKHKYSEKAFLQKRSRKLISWLNDIEEERFQMPVNLSIVIIVNEAPENIYKNNNLLKEVPDDRILATVLNYKSQNSDKKVSIITADFALSLKAKKFNIPVISPNEDYRLEATVSEEEKQIKSLERENRRLRNSVPNIEISFKDGNIFCSKTIRKPLQFQDGFEEMIKERIKKKFPKKEFKKIKENKGFATIDLARIKFPSPLKKPIDKYNVELEEFYDEYLEYKKNQFLFLQSERRSFELKIKISNLGSVPAEDVDIWLHFPDGFKVLDGTENIVERIEKPTPPSEMYSSGIGTIPHSILGSRFPDYSNFNPPSNVGSLNIKKSNSYEVNSSIIKIKHNQFEILDPIKILFYPDDEVKGFNIEYKIDIGNYPERLEGYLNVNVNEK